jgi:phosphatidate cytidylyltransferase
MRWGDLQKRVLSALVLAPLAIAALWFGGWLLAGLTVLLMAGLGVEWWRMSWHGGNRPGLLIGGLLWIVLAAAALLWLRADPVWGRADVLFLVPLVWASDIGAYLVGRLIGGKRLAPRISPGKTWAGAVGGLLAAVLVGCLIASLLDHGMVAWRVALVAGGLGIVAQVGDLLESLVKRHCGVKDSGGLIPGHGGLFDRLDGVMAVLPVAAMLALAQGSGVALWG